MTEVKYDLTKITAARNELKNVCAEQKKAFLNALARCTSHEDMESLYDDKEGLVRVHCEDRETASKIQSLLIEKRIVCSVTPTDFKNPKCETRFVYADINNESEMKKLDAAVTKCLHPEKKVAER